MGVTGFEGDVQGWMSEFDVDIALNMVSQLKD